MAEFLTDSSEQALESTTVGIFRTATVVKGGRRFSFAALTVVGDRRGDVGVGYGKAPGVPAAIEKAQKDARKHLVTVNLQSGTLPHPITSRFGSSIVRLVPAAPGTGVIAGATVRAVLELAGVRDCLTKAYGSTNKKNLCKAALEGLKEMRTREQIESWRGVTIEPTTVEVELKTSKAQSDAATTEKATVAAPQAAVPAAGKVEDKAPEKAPEKAPDMGAAGGVGEEAVPEPPTSGEAPEAPAAS